jgi:hypothetical protein
MSLTIRDAQHLSWKTLKKLEKLEGKMSEDLGSASGLVGRARGIAEKVEKVNVSDSEVSREELANSLAEMLFTALVLAERYGLSLEESFLRSVDDLILKFVS